MPDYLFISLFKDRILPALALSSQFACLSLSNRECRLGITVPGLPMCFLVQLRNIYSSSYDSLSFAPATCCTLMWHLGLKQKPGLYCEDML